MRKPVHHVDAAPCIVNTAPIERGFLAAGTSNPLTGLDLIGTTEVARILEVHPSNVTMQMHRKTFAIKPAVIVADGRRFWHRADVIRAKELLAKPAPTDATPAQS